MTVPQRQSASRIGWVDAVRAGGAIAIVILHVLVSATIAFDISSLRQVLYTLVGIVGCRWAVPAFFMITGYLMLDPHREVDVSYALRHVRRMVLVIALFGTAYALMEEVWVRVSSNNPVDPFVPVLAIADVLTMQTWDHMWFVYALVGVYMLVPVVRWVAERFGHVAYARLTMALFALVLCVPTLLGTTVAQGPITSFFWNIAIGITCACVGGCLRDWELSPAWIAVGIGSAIVMVVVSVTGIGSGVGDQGYVFLQGSCFATLYAVMLLLLAKRFVGDAPLSPDAMTRDLARDSFGIYLVHPIFIHLGIIAVQESFLVPVLYEVLFCALALVASIATTRLLRFIPLVRDLL